MVSWKWEMLWLLRRKWLSGVSTAVSLPPFSFEVPVQRRKLAHSKSHEQEQTAEGRSAVSAGSSQGCSSAPPCFPACPRTVSRLWGHKSSPGASCHCPAVSMYHTVLPVPPIVSLPSRNQDTEWKLIPIPFPCYSTNTGGILLYLAFSNKCRRSLTYLDMSPFIAIKRSTRRCEQSFSGKYCHMCLVGL